LPFEQDTTPSVLFIYSLSRTLSPTVTVKTKRYYFGTLNVKSANVNLSLLKPTGGLPPDLYLTKKKMGFTLLNFEDANVDLGML